MDPEPARSVVGRRHHPAPVRIAADDERFRLQLWRLQLLDGREERVEIEVRDDQDLSSTMRIGTPRRRATYGIVEP